MSKERLTEDMQTRRMVNTIKMLKETHHKIHEGTQKDGGKEFPITKDTANFGDVRSTQEETLIKTVGESIEFTKNALVYKPDTKDLILTGKITSLGLTFQFRYNDPSGDGCYIWVEELQLTETNQKTIGKIRDGFLNWKSGILQNGDLLEKLEQVVQKNS